MAGVDLAPGLAAVVRAVDLVAARPLGRRDAAALVLLGLLGRRRPPVAVLDDGVEDVGVLLVDVEADPADAARRQAAAEAGPLLAAVGRLVDGALRPADLVVPGQADLVVHGRVERVGRRFDQGQVDGPDLVVDVEDLLPGLPAVGRLEDAALGVRREEMAHDGDVDRVGVLRVDEDPGDVVGIRQAHVRPGLAGVDRLPDAVARARAPGAVGLPGSDPDDVRRRSGPRRRRRSRAWAGRRRRARRSCRCSPSSRRRRCASRRRACRGARATGRPARRSSSPTTRPGRARGRGRRSP